MPLPPPPALCAAAIAGENGRVHARRKDRRAPAPAAVPRTGWTGLRLALLAGGVGLTVLVVFWPVLDARALCLDDPEYLLHNPLVRNPTWDSTRRFLTEVRAPSSVRGYYQPLPMISLMLDVAAGAGEDNLRPLRRTSLLLHVLTTMGVVVLLARLVPRTWAAAGAGLLFGLHPLTVEPVAWLAERKTLLAGLFTIVALIAYLRYVRRPSAPAYLLLVFSFACGLLSKPTSAPLPLLLLALDFWPLWRLSWRAVWEKLPLLALAAAGVTVSLVSQRATAGVATPDQAGLVGTLLVVCHNVVFYLAKTLWPSGLSPLYLPPEPMSLASGAVLAGVIGTPLLAALVLASLRWTRALAACAAFFYLALAPALGVIVVHGAIAADRHAYVPLIGVALWMAWVLSVVTSGRRRAVAAGAVVGVLLLAGAAALVTRHYLGYWQTSERIHRRMAERAPRAVQPHWDLAFLLQRAGRVPEALDEYRAAVTLAPDRAELRANFGAALVAAGDLAAAETELRAALRLDPGEPLAHSVLGGVFKSRGQLAEAVEEYRQAVQQAPARADFRNNLGVALELAGRREEAIEQYEQAAALQPDFQVPRTNLARLCTERARRLELQGQREAAIAELRRALQWDPTYGAARQRLTALEGRP